MAYTNQAVKCDTLKGAKRSHVSTSLTHVNLTEQIKNTFHCTDYTLKLRYMKME